MRFSPRHYIIALLIAWSIALVPVHAQTSMQISPVRFDIPADPGQTKVDTIKIYNNSPMEQTFAIEVEDFYAADEFGKPAFRKGDADTRYSVSAWIVPESESVTIPAQEFRDVRFNVVVPANAEPGGHYGAIFFSPPQGEDGQVAIQGRIGALLLVDVRGDVLRDTAIDTFGIYHPEVDFQAGLHTTPRRFFTELDIPFALRLHNQGNVHERPKAKITITNLWGQTIDQVGVEPITTPEGILLRQEVVDYLPVNPEQGVILPETYRTFRNITWDGYAEQRYNTKTGEVDIVKERPWLTIGRFTATLTLELQAETITEEVHFWILPIVPIIGILLALLLLILVVRFALHHYRASILRHHISHQPNSTNESNEI